MPGRNLMELAFLVYEYAIARKEALIILKAGRECHFSFVIDAWAAEATAPESGRGGALVSAAHNLAQLLARIKENHIDNRVVYSRPHVQRHLPLVVDACPREQRKTTIRR